MKEVLITSTVLIVALLLLRWVFAKKVRRTWIYAAWLLVALRLLIPVQIGQLVFSVLTSARPITAAITSIAERQVTGVTEQDAYRQVLQNYIEEDISVFIPEVQEHIQSAMEDKLSREEIAVIIGQEYPNADAFVPEIHQQVQQKVEKTTDTITLGQILTAIWLTGVVVMVVWLATANLLIGRSLRRPEEALVCESPIPVYVSKKAGSPCLIGLFRPAVYLPYECAADENILCYSLTHELTHYAHKDHIWALVRCICLCVYWFDPLVWVAAWFSRRDCELACDEGAINRLGEEKRIAYGKALLQVVTNTVVPGKLMLITTTMAETKKQLKERVAFIARKPKRSIAAAICMALFCFVVVGCVTTGPVEIGPVETDTIETLPSEPTDPVEKMPWEISEEEQDKVKQEFIQYMSFANHTCTTEDVDLVVISCVDTGYAVVIDCLCGSVELDVSWEDLHANTVEQWSFFLPNGWWIQLCKDGDFLPLEAAYYSGWLNDAQMQTIWNDYHAQFPEALDVWERVNGSLTEPSDPNFCDLKYVVNKDGVSCTVSSMGECRVAELVIPEYIDGYRVTAIGKEAFRSRTILKSVVIPDGVISIGENAFEGCTELESIRLPDTLTKIGMKAFLECSSLVSIVIPDGVTYIGNATFKGCGSLESATIPESVISIGERAFYECVRLSQITIPAGVNTLKREVFYRCCALTNVTLPDAVASIESHAFFGCSGLRRVYIPDGVTQIGNTAFGNCTALEEIVIPDSVTFIADAAFQNCIALSTLTIGKNAHFPNTSTLKNCCNLKFITVAPDNPYYYTQNGCLIEKERHLLVIAVHDAVIPKDGSVRSIGVYAFYGRTDLERIILPEGLEKIEGYAFTGCVNLKELYIPQSVVSIGIILEGCSSLETIDFGGTLAQWKTIKTGSYLGDGVQVFTIRCTDGESEKK